jgi:hypothetical protein
MFLCIVIVFYLEDCAIITLVHFIHMLSVINDITSCGNVKGCAWPDSMCISKPAVNCNRYGDMNVCNEKDGCLFIGGVCSEDVCSSANVSSCLDPCIIQQYDGIRKREEEGIFK